MVVCTAWITPPKFLTPWPTLVQKYLNLTGLTMNPGASRMSSVGTVRSRMAARANTSSTTGTARVKRWAMRWKWAVSLLCGRDGNLSFGLIARGGGKVASPCTDVITACVWLTLRLPPASCFTFHLSWQSLNLNLCSSSVWLILPPTSLLSEWKQLQGYCCCGGKNVFISARTAAQTAAHLYSGHCAHLNLSGWVGGDDDAFRLPWCMVAEIQIVAPKNLKAGCFWSSRRICIWIGAAQCLTYNCGRYLSKSELQSLFIFAVYFW